MKRSTRLRWMAGILALVGIFAVTPAAYGPEGGGYLFILATAVLLVSEIVGAIEDASREGRER